MGARNVAAVFTHWTHLAHAPFRVLTFMALVAKDGDEPHYWGGAAAIAGALGRVPGPDGFIEHKDHAAVSAAVMALVRAGAVRSLVRPVRGRRGEYALVLDPRTGQGEPDESEPGDSVDNPPIGQDEPDESQTARGRMVRLSLTPNQAEPDGYQAEPDGYQAQPDPRNNRNNKGTGRKQETQVSTSPARVVPLGKTEHGCIRGWLPDDAGQRGTTPCETCNPRTAHLAAAVPDTPPRRAAATPTDDPEGEPPW